MQVGVNSFVGHCRNLSSKTDAGFRDLLRRIKSEFSQRRRSNHQPSAGIESRIGIEPPVIPADVYSLAAQCERRRTDQTVLHDGFHRPEDAALIGARDLNAVAQRGC